ncbi:MAG: UDP-N-acetylmuramoyl-L-alanyl-D-glutamate synthetase [Methanoregula sp. PtaU1.Bin051]|nr:MAG: UDP-N-acetylmuramoyl-L-alanyl-D-glutamate synthetase [Methanoregula sp. PtaU1.Bin051]
MKFLVLDTIHGGIRIGSAFKMTGFDVDMVDVYRNSSVPDTETALSRAYDFVVAPVHLDPDHPLLRRQAAPVISHHEAVRMLLKNDVPHPMVEITGKRGKTTTATALASIMPGRGVLLSSRGIVLYPEERTCARVSITPASVLPAARAALRMTGWFVAEESLGVSGAGDLAILTSGETYPIAAGKKDALTGKLASLRTCKKVLVAPGISCDLPQSVHLEDAAVTDGRECRITAGGATTFFKSSLLELDAYRIPLMLAGTAAVMLGIDPAGLEKFTGIEGRMSVQQEGDLIILDNANSGTNADTTFAAAEYARACAGSGTLTLVIGIEPGDGKVCEGFPDTEIAAAIRQIRPSRLVLVGPVMRPPIFPEDLLAGTYIYRAPTLSEGRKVAVSASTSGSIVLAVKTWR